MRTASASSIFGLRRCPSVVGKRIHPNPSAETFQSSFPNLRYCIVLSSSLRQAKLYPQALLPPCTHRRFRRSHKLSEALSPPNTSCAIPRLFPCLRDTPEDTSVPTEDAVPKRRSTYPRALRSPGSHGGAPWPLRLAACLRPRSGSSIDFSHHPAAAPAMLQSAYLRPATDRVR